MENKNIEIGETMKKYTYILALLSLCACSNDLDVAVEQQQSANAKQVSSAEHRVDKLEALEYANAFLEKGRTRSNGDVRVDYVLDNAASTRAVGNGNDTVAYIFNWGENDGFAIVAADNRVYPVLAYSEKGMFSNEKGSVTDVFFTSKIGAYIREQVAGVESGEIEPFPAEALNDASLLQTVHRGPYMTSEWCYGYNRGVEWDKYIKMAHPGCAIGDATIAATSIMVHCKDELTYYGIDFPLAEIREGLRGTPEAWADETISPVPFDVAVDYASRLLMYVGADINTQYGELKSSADYKDVAALLSKLGFLSPGATFEDYGLDIAVTYLEWDNLLLMDGVGVNSSTVQREHYMWVVDGYSYQVDTDTQRRSPLYIHCDFGREGADNGSYNSNVFHIGSGVYSSGIKICPVMVENPWSVFWDKYRIDRNDPYW